MDHKDIDIKREYIPISASMIRENPIKHWNTLSMAVKGYLAKRIVIVGAESTGTTTLAKDIARKTLGGTELFVPEYGRQYTEEKLHGNVWKDQDFINIALHQQALEDRHAEVGGPYLICDTNAWATRIWQERYMGRVHEDVDWLAENCKADLYILTSERNVPFEQDGTRDGGLMVRKWMNQEFRERLSGTGVPWIELSGSKALRETEAIAAVSKLTWRFSPPLTTEGSWRSPQS